MFDDINAMLGQNSSVNLETVQQQTQLPNYSKVFDTQIRENVVEDQFVSLKLTGVALMM